MDPTADHSDGNLVDLLRAEVELLQESKRMGRLCRKCQRPLGTGEIEDGLCWRCDHSLITIYPKD